MPGRVLAAVAGLAITAWAANAADMAETLDRVYSEHNLQTELPITERPLAEPPVAFRGAPWLLAVLLAVGLIVLLGAWAASVDWQRLRERKLARGGLGRAAGGALGDGHDWLGVADARARQGRYAEAIHALLLGALGVLAPNLRVPAAATPREIAATHLKVPDLLTLVSAAELAHFGGRAASEAEYRACRAQALRLRRGLAQQPRRAESPASHATPDTRGP